MLLLLFGYTLGVVDRYFVFEEDIWNRESRGNEPAPVTRGTLAAVVVSLLARSRIPGAPSSISMAKQAVREFGRALAEEPVENLRALFAENPLIAVHSTSSVWHGTRR